MNYVRAKPRKAGSRRLPIPGVDYVRAKGSREGRFLVLGLGIALYGSLVQDKHDQIQWLVLGSGFVETQEGGGRAPKAFALFSECSQVGIPMLRPCGGMTSSMPTSNANE